MIRRGREVSHDGGGGVITRVDVPTLFGHDGSWREIWVLRSTEADWDAFLNWIHTAFTATINYLVDG
jgi:hypothetical protein